MYVVVHAMLYTYSASDVRRERTVHDIEVPELPPHGTRQRNGRAETRIISEYEEELMAEVEVLERENGSMQRQLEACIKGMQAVNSGDT